MTPDWIFSFAEHFTAADYLLWSRVQGTAWSLADVVIVFYLLRIANLCRDLSGLRRHRLSYATLAATLPLIALVPVLPSPQAFFRLELLITVPHFLLILYIGAADFHNILQALGLIIVEKGAPQLGETESRQSD